MKKIGKEVLFLNTSENNQRNGEGDFIRLNDGRIMFAYTEFIGNHWGDNAIAQIVALFSSDEGETWRDKKILIQKKEDELNLMCPSLLKMGNGDIGIFYGAKYTNEDGNLYSQLWFRRTNDNFKTLSEPTPCFDKKLYYVSENGRVIRHSSGRIIFPVNLHPTKGGLEIELVGKTCYFFSDDDGKTFYDSGVEISNPFSEDASGLQETGIVEIENGKLFSFSRTGSGSQFESFSEDYGDTWTVPKPSILFSSPVSPMHIRHLNNDTTVAIFNPKIALGPETTKGAWSRTPLAAYICKGKGENFWKNASFYMLEDDLTNGYCYPVVFSGDDYFLCAYYHSNGADYCLNACKMVRVSFSELD